MLSIILWLFATIAIGTIAAMIGKRYGVEYLIAMFAACIVIANATVAKVIEIGPFTTTAGLVVFSITFLLTDTISEFWGKAMARKAVWSGFLAVILFVFTTQIAISLPAASFWSGQESFVEIFGGSLRVAVASFLAYLVAQNHDVWAYHFWKKKTKGKYLWLRNNLSTWVSQTIDTVIFGVIAFAGVLPLGPFILGTIVLKVIIAAVDTPFLYFIRWYYEKTGKRWVGNKDHTVGPLPTP